MISYDFILFRMIAYVFIWFHMISYDFIWFLMISYDFLWFHMISYDFVWFRLNSFDFYKKKHMRANKAAACRFVSHFRTAAQRDLACRFLEAWLLRPNSQDGHDLDLHLRSTNTSLCAILSPSLIALGGPVWYAKAARCRCSVSLGKADREYMR